MTILTEKENVAKNYAAALNLKKTQNGLYASTDGKIKLTYAAGHLYTLYDMKDYDQTLSDWYNIKKLPYIPKNYLTKPDNGFKNTKKSTRLNCEKILRDAVKTKDEIVIATDPDREGEVIARFILEKLKADKSLITRVWCCEGVNKEEVLKGLSERKKDSEYDFLYKKGRSQKESDWCMGTNLTRLMTLLKNDGTLWSVGRVQTAVMQELYDRNMQIMLFVKKKYYELEVETKEGLTFIYDSECNAENPIFNKEDAEGVKKEVIKNGTVLITSFTTEQKVNPVPMLFDSAELGSESFNLYGIPLDKTLEISQRLYNEKGCISYPRTASSFLKEEDYEVINRRYEEFTEKYLKNKKSLNKENRRVFNTKKCEGHHAIIPTKENEQLSDEEKKVYELILNRFLMQGLGENIVEHTKAFADCGKVILRAEGKKTLQKGWRKIDPHKSEEDREINIKKGEVYHVKDVRIIEKETKPPKYYTQSTLIKFMKNPGGKDEEGDEILSIGTQATQAAIIKTLFDRKYITESKKNIMITDRGIKLIETVREISELDKNTKVTATTMWDKMNEKDPDNFIRYIEKLTKKIFSDMEEKLNVSIQKTKAGICPACGGDILEGKNGWYCSNYKAKGCENNLSFHMMGVCIDKNVMETLLKDKKTDVFSGTKKDGNPVSFYIKVSEEGKFNIVFLDDNSEVCSCPLCGKGIKEYNKVYKCQNSECDFFMWKRTNGIDFMREDIKKLCGGEEIEKEMTKKDGSMCRVKVMLSDDKKDLKINFINRKE